MDVRLTARMVEIFYQGQRLCSHPRHYGRPGHYETNPDHMSSNHLAYLSWNADRFRNWADKIGKYTREIIEHMLSARPHEQQAYKVCMSLLKFADKYTAVRLEKACEKAIWLQAPRYRVVKNILESGQDRLPVRQHTPKVKEVRTHHNVRGDEYYARLAKDMQKRQIPINQLINESEK